MWHTYKTLRKKYSVGLKDNGWKKIVKLLIQRPADVTIAYLLQWPYLLKTPLILLLKIREEKLRHYCYCYYFALKNKRKISMKNIYPVLKIPNNDILNTSKPQLNKEKVKKYKKLDVNLQSTDLKKCYLKKQMLRLILILSNNYFEL